MKRLMKIVSESGIAAGIRRIEAITGEKALVALEQKEQALGKAAKLLKAKPEQVLEKLEHILSDNRQLDKALQAAKAQLAAAAQALTKNTPHMFFNCCSNATIQR